MSWDWFTPKKVRQNHVRDSRMSNKSMWTSKLLTWSKSSENYRYTDLETRKIHAKGMKEYLELIKSS